MTPERLAFTRAELARIQSVPCHARLWSYEASHSIFTLRIEQPAGERLVLRGEACRAIRAPISWRPSQLTLDVDDATDDAVLRDAAHDVEIRAAIILPEGCDLPGPYDHLQPE